MTKERYPGFNGLFTKIIFQWINTSLYFWGSFAFKGLSTITLVDDEIFRETKNDFNNVGVIEKN